MATIGGIMSLPDDAVYIGGDLKEVDVKKQIYLVIMSESYGGVINRIAYGSGSAAYACSDGYNARNIDAGGSKFARVHTIDFWDDDAS